MENAKKFILKHKYVILFLICIDCLFLGSFKNLFDGIRNPFSLMFIIVSQLMVLWLIAACAKNRKITAKNIIFFIFAMGFLLRLVYILSTNGSMTSQGYFIPRQHDVHWFFGPDEYRTGLKNGHAAYIEYFYFGNGLPDFDVRKIWQFYHPPLWHMICALWLKIQTVLGITYTAAIENLQLLSLFCSSMIMLLAHRLFGLFRLKGKALIIAFSIAAFHPAFIMLAGSINNDVLSIMLILMSLVFAVEWYRQPGFRKILKLALSIGLAMAAKLSGAIVAIAVAFLFVLKFIKQCVKKEKVWNFIGQYAAFLGVCAPIGLFYGIRNLIKFKVPLLYVPELSINSTQYIGSHSVFERLFDISSLWETGIYPARATEYLAGKYGYTYYDYNIPVSVLKSSVFGEYYFGADSALTKAIASVMFWSAAVLAVLSAVCVVIFIIKLIKGRINQSKNGIIFENENGFSFSEGVFTLIFYFSMILSYTKFCFDFPHFCTMDFRYIALTVVVGALYIGLFSKKLLKNNNMSGKIVFACIALTTVLFALSTSLIYAFAV